MPLRNWIESANNAIEGILHAAKTERHLRYHLYTATTVLVLSYFLGIDRIDFLIIAIAVILVLLAEMLNTAVEYVVDMISPDRSEKARITKDVAAGAVLITAFGAAVLGFFIIFPYITKVFEKGLYIAKQPKEGIAVVSLIVILILVIILKAYSGKGHPLRGGMPSGHSAVAFSIWTAITYITESFIASILSFILASFIAQSRVTIKVHTPLEVIIGGFIGIIVTFLLFFIFS